MSEELWRGVITGGATFLGAIIGFIAAWITSKRTASVTREQLRVTKAQRRYDVVLDKRAETLPEICLNLYELLIAAEALADQPLLLPDRHGEKAIDEALKARSLKKDQLVRRVGKQFRYYKKNAIWLPKDLSEPIGKLLDDFGEKVSRYADSLRQSGAVAKIAADAEAKHRGEDDLFRNAAQLLQLLAENQAEESIAEAKEWLAEVEEVLGADAADRMRRGEGLRTQPEAEDPNAGKPLGEIYGEVFRRHQAVEKMIFTSWLYKEGWVLWEEIFQRSRDILDVDLADERA